MAAEEHGRKRANEMRRRDPFMDRRCGEDRRKIYSLSYFQAGNPDRRKGVERRSGLERRADCIRITPWSSVCPDYEDEEYTSGKVRIASGGVEKKRIPAAIR